MAASFNSTTAAAFLQRFYSPDFIVNSAAMKASRLWSQLKKFTGGGGDTYNFLSVLNEVATGSADFSTAQTMAANGTTTVGGQFSLAWCESNEPVRVKGKVIAQTKNSTAAWTSALKFAMDSAIRIAAHRFSVALYTQGWGELGTVNTVSGATFKMVNASQIHRLIPGMAIVGSSSLNAATLRSATAITITNIDYTANVVTCDTNLSTPGITNNDWIFTSGDRQNSASPTRLRPTGLRAWFPTETTKTDATVTTLHGVDRSVNSRYYGWKIDGSAIAILDAFIAACQTVSSYGNSTKMIGVTSPANFSAIAKAMGSEKRYVDVQGAGGIGFRTLEVFADGVSCPLISDKYCDDLQSYVGDPSTFEVESIGPTPYIDQTDGNKVLRISDDNGVECRITSYSNFAAKNPPAWAVIDHVGICEMADASRTTFPLQGIAANAVLLAGQFIITTAGAVLSQTGAQLSGATVAYVASGLYTVTFYKTFARSFGGHCNMVGPDSSAFPTTTGSQPQIRVDTTSGFKIQFVRADTQADTDPASGTKCNWLCWVQTS